MSVQATSWVWSSSNSRGNARLLLLAIADAADQHGENSWPAQPTLAAMVGVSVRTVRRLVDDLVTMGELEVQEFAGGTAHTRSDRRPHLYRLPKMPGPDGRTTMSPRRDTGGQTGVHGRTSGCERADTVVRITSFLEHPEKNNPSRGAAPAASAARSPEEDEPMPARKPPAEQPLPFDLPEPVKAEPAPSARDVVAAFVTSYAENHSGGRPVPADIGRVSRDAKAALSAGKASVPELVAAATALGATPYANLGVQLGITRSSRPVARIAPVAPRGSFDEAHHQSKLRFAEKIRTDAETAAWVAQDPAEVQNMIDFDPTLLEAFRAVGAA